MGFRKLLSLFCSKREKPAETLIFSQTKVAPTKIIMLLPAPIQNLSQKCTSKLVIIPEEPGREKVTQTENEELCEEPRPMEEFHAVSVEVASEKAAEKGLVILFKEIDKCDLFGRRRVYWALTPEFAEKLLRCTIDAKPAEEFTPAETLILNVLAARKWLQKIKDKEGVYFCGLSQRTAVNLQKQIAI